MPTHIENPSPASTIPASLFSVVLGLSGLGQSWRVAARLWRLPIAAGEIILLSAGLVWFGLLAAYALHAARRPALTAHEFRHPVVGGTPALLGISTLLIATAAVPYSRVVAWGLALAGIGWHLLFSVWHTGALWQGGRINSDTAPTLYLPTVAGNFTAAGALGALGQPQWAWLFLGTGIFSWLALEPLIIQRLWQGDSLPAAQRPLLGIQFAPPVVCAAAILVIAPDTSPQWLLMLLGYGLFQMLVGLRLKSWLSEQPFGYSWWAYSFGVVSATVTCLKLAAANVPAASQMAPLVFVAGNLFIGYLCARTLARIAGSVKVLAAA